MKTKTVTQKMLVCWTLLAMLGWGTLSYAVSTVDFSNGMLHLPRVNADGVKYDNVYMMLDFQTYTFQVTSSEEHQWEEMDIILSGGQQVPAVSTNGAGFAYLEVNTSTGAISGIITVRNLENVTAAHIHSGAADETGPIVTTFTHNETTGQFSLPADSRLSSADLTALQEGKLYINVHTSAHPSGELRGQLDLESYSEIHGK